MQKFLIKTFKGLEKVLAEEVKQLGAKEIVHVSRGVLCEADAKFIYRANLELRTGLRVYQWLADIDANTPDELYHSVGSYDWASHLKPSGTLYVTCTAGHTPWVKNDMIVSLKTKDAIVDKLRIGETRPNVDRDRPDIRVHTYVHKGKGSVWLDSTGDPLFKRGYRLRTADAPINEVLAAGILKLAGYTPTQPLVDPMCGSGTFAIEAARMALNIPSQNERRYFAFMNWPSFDSSDWTLVRQQALSRIHKGAIAPIIASDIDRRTVRYAERNISESGLRKRIELHEADFFDVAAPYDKGLMVINPPYDERLPIEEGEFWYSDVGNYLKDNWAGWKLAIVSGFMEGMSALHVTPDERIEMDNGGIPVELWKLDIRSRKPKVQQGGFSRRE